MRRTVGLATVGLCALLTVTGVARAAVSEERPTSVAERLPAQAAQPAVVAPNAGAPIAAVTAPIAGAASVPDAPSQTVGAVEPVTGGVLDLAGGRRRMELHYPGARYVKVHFSSLLTRPGDSVTVTSRDGSESYSYSSIDGPQWAMSVSGDTAIVELHRTGDDLPGAGDVTGVTVDRVARGFTPRERALRGPAAGPGLESGREESVCGRTDDTADAVCYRADHPVAYQRSKAVARLLINGVELCTGWRVGPDNRMLTNQHCLNNTGDARRTEVWFNYECESCGGWDVLRTTKVWGDRVLATGTTLDYALFTVTDFDTVQKFGFLELDARRPVAGEELYIPQHPRGDPTVIAMADTTEAGGNCAVANPEYDGYGTGTDLSYYCDTDGGSSGSPVISATSHKVIGLHHFGGCPNSGVRVDRIVAEIGNLL